jgi:Arc/MetJ family transcription regulator
MTVALPNAADRVRQEFEAFHYMQWEGVAQTLSGMKGEPFCLEYREVDAQVFQPAIATRYVLGCVDPAAWGESKSPKCLHYGKGKDVSAIGNLASYFTKPSWAWEQKKINAISFDREEFRKHLSAVFSRVATARAQLEEGFRGKTELKLEEAKAPKEEFYVHILLHQLVKAMDDASLLQKMHRYIGFMQSAEEYWQNQHRYFTQRMNVSKEMVKRYETLEKILSA